MSVEIVPLTRQRRDIDRFLAVAYPIYAQDPHWVAPLLFDQRKVFTDANPLFEHAELHLWLAILNGRDVGRIATVLDHNYNQTQGQQTLFFGFFEAINDPEVSHALFNAVRDHARSKGLRQLMGPMNPTSNDECGLLVQGPPSDPVFMMPYNPPYYADLITAEGYRKAKDLLAFYIDLKHSPLERLGRIADKCRERNPELTFRAVTKRSLRRDLAHIKTVYNGAWEDNWGFTPMTDAEIDFLADRLKPLLVEGLVWLVEAPDGPVAFLLAVPDFNQAIKPLRGRLCTPRLFSQLPWFLGWKTPDFGRVITLGVVEGYRGRGLEAVMLAEGLKVGFRIGFTAAEASWVLEDNVRMRRVIEVFGAKPYKTYRIYEREV
ncbi:MAG TPA: N-acetyltransferase [Verrucomicrobiota bacterium]|nr:N-acetyltransferase [Verrucomicrobiota bacterium]HNU49445.1 N-acetyltransferase [Verrucomicrobiota bacterium]